MSDNPGEDLSLSMYCLANVDHLLAHSDPPPSSEWPIISPGPSDDNIHMFLLEDGQLALSNGLQLFLNPLPLDEIKSCEDAATIADQNQSTSIMSLPRSECSETMSEIVDSGHNISSGDILLSDNHNTKILAEGKSVEVVTLDEDVNETSLLLDVAAPSESPDCLNDFVDVVTTFKCRMCLFSACSRDLLILHIKAVHIDKKLISEEQMEVQNPMSEKLVYLCAQCAEGFETLEDCRSHMVEDHNLVTGKAGDVEEIAEELKIQDPPPSKSPLPSSAALSPSLSSEKQPEVEEAELQGRRKTRLPRVLEEEFVLEKNRKLKTATEKKFKCLSYGCLAKFASEKELDTHDLCHNNEERDFRCCECSERFEKWKLCAIHLWHAHQIDVGLATCDICGYKTGTTLKLAIHRRIHSEAREFHCSVCQKGFKQLSQLKNHSVIHMDKRNTSSIPKWYAAKKCEICHKTYSDSKCLKKHIAAVHGRIRPYSCPVCGHTSARKAMLQLHLRQHTGEKPYSCEDCGFRTGDHNSLRRHKMRHSGQRPYRCPHCDYSAIQSNSYKNHLRNRHPDKKGGMFECGSCSFRSVSEESYISHMSEHRRQHKAEQSLAPVAVEEEVFPGNVAAAQFIFRCLSNIHHSPNSLRANVTSKETSPDGSEQTITIQIPTSSAASQGPSSDDGFIQVEDLVDSKPMDEPDLGGITIPANPSPPPPIEEFQPTPSLEDPQH